MDQFPITQIIEFFAALFNLLGATLGIVGVVIATGLAMLNCVIGSVGIIIAVAAALAAWKAVHETRRSSQAQVASALLETYADKFMLEDMEHLRKWKKDHPGTFVDDFIVQREAGLGEAPRVDRARRHMAHYLQKAAILLQKDLIDRDLLKYVISDTTVDFATEFVEPLDIAIGQKITNNPNPSWAYDIMRGLHSRPMKGPPIAPADSGTGQ